MTFNRDWVLSVARRYATSMEDTGPALQQCLDEIDRLGREVAGSKIAIANWRLQTGCGTCFDASRVINDLQGAVVEQTVRADRAEAELAAKQQSSQDTAQPIVDPRGLVSGNTLTMECHSQEPK